MKKIILIRHAETDLAGSFCGQSDPPLNALGRLQLASLQSSLAAEKIDMIVSSNLLRAQQTAAALQSSHQLPVMLDADLNEIHFGAWEGLTWHQIEASYPEESLAWLQHFPNYTAPGGESYTAFCARVQVAMDRILTSTCNTIAVVTHAGVLRAALQHLTGCSFADAQERQFGYGTYFVYEASND